MDWDDLDIFCNVIDHGSFTAAAKALRRPKSSVSASIARLEGRLGTRVIERTTRRLRLTEAGESLYREMSPLFAHLREALGAAAAMGESVSGHLRIAAPYEFGAHHLGAVACAMLGEHRSLEIDIDVEHQPVNLFDQQYDIVFTMIDKDLPSTSGVARRVFSLERGLFASPSFLDHVEQPLTPYDLKNLPLLAAASDTEWSFADSNGGRHSIPVAGPRL
jgi:DNA-binding transcriptional LysR family regulator